MSSVLSTSTMKSPPLVVWVCGSFSGEEVSSAAWIGPGATALSCARGAAPWAAAATGGVTAAAAPASVTPLRNLRRSGSGNGRRFDMVFLQKVRFTPGLFHFEVDTRLSRPLWSRSQPRSLGCGICTAGYAGTAALVDASGMDAARLAVRLSCHNESPCRMMEVGTAKAGVITIG